MKKESVKHPYKDMGSVFKIEGYHAVLPHVQNVYPVEKEKFYWGWGFKYCSGVFEFFSYKTKGDAQKIHDLFLKALNSYWETHNNK